MRLTVAGVALVLVLGLPGCGDDTKTGAPKVEDPNAQKLPPPVNAKGDGKGAAPKAGAH